MRHLGSRFAGPHHLAIHLAQTAASRAFPELDDRLPRNASGLLQEVLQRHGHPLAAEAFVMEHPDRHQKKSQAIFQPDWLGEHHSPGVALHPERWNYRTLAHEAAHHLDMVSRGMLDETNLPRDLSPGDHITHDPSFAERYRDTLNHFAPGSGDHFHEIYHQALPNQLRNVGTDRGRSLFRNHDELVRHLQGGRA